MTIHFYSMALRSTSTVISIIYRITADITVNKNIPV